MRCVILDSSAVFHVRDLSILLSLGEKLYVTEHVLREIRDPRARALIELLRPEVMHVDQREIERLMREAPGLSEADCSILVCVDRVRELGKCDEIIVLTDDALLRRYLRKRGVKVVSIYFGRMRTNS